MPNIFKLPVKDANGQPQQDLLYKRFEWKHLPFPLLVHYDNLLAEVIEKDESIIPAPDATDFSSVPNYYNPHFCLALGKQAPSTPTTTSLSKSAALLAPRCSVTDVSTYFLGNCRPFFHYERESAVGTKQSHNGSLDLELSLQSIGIGSVIWLYFYERMGIFKILSALLDDYNYRGKYTISSNPYNSGVGFNNDYRSLIEHISLLYRMGLSSNVRDRICLYQKVLGVSIESSLEVTSERNEGFMTTYSESIDYMLEYYNARQLATAIQGAATIQNGIRTNVATTTRIGDKLRIFQQQFEPFEYGRNQINTFIGIATVYATICLIRLIKNEVGVPTQYDSPHEFIPAIYDILVLKRPVTPSQVNRFTIYDNCASYGYRLLTDIECTDITKLKPSPVDAVFNDWLNDVEGIVEGYRNAYAAVPEKAVEMV